jgi:flagellar FliL protein
MLNKIMKILNAVSQVILIIIALISLFTAYIVFAPDQLPKPFRLMYVDPGTTQVIVAEAAEVHEATPEHHTFLPGEGVMLDMSTKIINLVDPTGHKYIRLTIVAEFAPDNPEYGSMPEEEKAVYLTEFKDELNARVPIMDDAVITLLSTKTYEDLYTADGKERLRAEIMNDLTGKLPDLHVISIYFTEFVVQ